MSAKYPSTLAPAGLMARTLPVLLPVLCPHFSLPTTKRILEFSSGEGAHLVEFAKLNPTKSFKATEADAFAVGAINDHVRRSNVTNVEEASVLDLLEESDWKALEAGEGKYQVVFGINFLHMVPCPQGPSMIFTRLRNVVDEINGTLVVYGPFKNDEGFFTENDEKFNKMIQARPNGSLLGLRSIDELERIAISAGWKLAERIAMPVGNWVLVFKIQKAVI